MYRVACRARSGPLVGKTVNTSGSKKQENLGTMPAIHSPSRERIRRFEGFPNFKSTTLTYHFNGSLAAMRGRLNCKLFHNIHLMPAHFATPAQLRVHTTPQT